jgi:hypothetical protein
MGAQHRAQIKLTSGAFAHPTLTGMNTIDAKFNGAVLA